tara:strand:- start:268 stop:789 length:522 start_codon:yes stop_codon:yes gene_type:complete
MSENNSKFSKSDSEKNFSTFNSDDLNVENSLTEIPSDFKELADCVSETNHLLDLALSNVDEDSIDNTQGKSLESLGSSLTVLFSKLESVSSKDTSNFWAPISEILSKLSRQIELRNSLKNDLKKIQSEIDREKLTLINQIETVVNQEKDHLSIVRLRSSLASAMAEKLINKLQ